MYINDIDNIKDFASLIDLFSTIFGFLLGFIIRGFTLTAKEKIDNNQQKVQNSQNIQNEFFTSFTAFNEHFSNLSAKDKATWNMQDKIDSTLIGEKYLQSLRNVCNSILSGFLHDVFIYGEHKHDINPKNITLYYKVISKIEKHLKIKSQKLNKNEYISVYKVYNLYCKGFFTTRYFKILKLIGLY
jgi:hypothetical protein